MLIRDSRWLKPLRRNCDEFGDGSLIFVAVLLWVAFFLYGDMTSKRGGFVFKRFEKSTPVKNLCCFRALKSLSEPTK